MMGFLVYFHKLLETTNESAKQVYSTSFYLGSICQENIPLDSRGRNKQVGGPQLLLLRGTSRAQSVFFLLTGPDLQGGLRPGVRLRAQKTAQRGLKTANPQHRTRREWRAAGRREPARKALGFSGGLQVCSEPQATRVPHPHAPFRTQSRRARPQAKLILGEGERK